jgi:hypothetical protein
MKMAESLSQAVKGMQKIEREIIDQVRGRGAALEASHFSWNNGRQLAELPKDLVHMDVRAKNVRVTADWSRTQLEDSCDRIDRMDVRQEIDRIVEELAPRLLKPSKQPFSVK